MALSRTNVRRLLALALAAVTVLVPTGSALAWTDPAPQPVDTHLIGANVSAGNGSWVPSQAEAVRLWNDGTRWSNLEPSRGTYNWPWLDYLVQHNTAAGKPVLLTLGETPHWASSNPGDTSCMFYAASHPTLAGSEPGQCQAPVSIADWDAYVRTVATRYRGRIEAYEMWNEVNLPTYWKGSVATLATMSAHAAAIIHSVDPVAKVVAPSVVFVQSTATVDYVLQLVAAGGFAGIDVAAVHLYYYQGPNAPELNAAGVQALQARLAAAGVHIPLWNTENAWGTTGTASATTQQMLIVRNWLVANYVRIPRSYYYTPIAYLPWEVTGSPAQLATQQLKRWYTGARIEGCGHGIGSGLPFDIWQCTFYYGSTSSGYSYGQVRWSTAGNYSEAAPTSTTQVEYVGSAAASARSGTAVTVSQLPVMVRFTSATPPSGSLVTPVPTYVGPAVKSVVAAPTSIDLTLPSVVSSGGSVRADITVHRSDISSVIPGAVIRVCTWSMTNGCVLLTTDSLGRASYSFRPTYSTTVTVDTDDASMQFLSVKKRVEAQSIIHAAGGPTRVSWAISPLAGQQYWLLHWNGTQWVTVVNHPVTTTATQGLAVPAGLYGVKTGGSSYITSTWSGNIYAY